MSFMNINKLNLEGSDDISIVMAEVVLMIASIVYDEVLAKDYQFIFNRLETLQCAMKSLALTLESKQEAS
jgi:hypothetical protein